VVSNFLQIFFSNVWKYSLPFCVDPSPLSVMQLIAIAKISQFVGNLKGESSYLSQISNLFVSVLVRIDDVCKRASGLVVSWRNENLIPSTCHFIVTFPFSFFISLLLFSSKLSFKFGHIHDNIHEIGAMRHISSIKSLV
jgi:hypothetical protein